MFGTPIVTLVLVSALFGIISQTMQVVLVNRKELRATQKKMKEKNAEMKELMKNDSPSKKQDIERVQAEMLELSAKSMKQMPKMMIGNMLVFLPLFGLVNHAYNATKFDLTLPTGSVFFHAADWFWVYVLCSLVVSSLTTKVLSYYDDHKEKKSMKNSTMVV